MKLILPASLSIFIAACGAPKPHSPTTSPATPVAVKAVSVANENWPDTYDATGAVRARATATLSSKVIASVQQVHVSVGDRVRQGQSLVTLDARDFEVNLRRAEAARSEIQSAVPEADHGIAAAKASLDLAQATFRRIDDLASKKSVSAQEFDEAAARLKAAQSAHEAARARRTQLDARLGQVEQEVGSASISLGYATIRAPFDGVVVTKAVDPGALAVPGAPLLTVERDGGYRLEVSVDESRLPAVRVGQFATVRFDALDRPIDARVSEIVPAVDAASHTYTVKIDLPPLQNIRSGVFGRAAFALVSRPVLAVPAAALIERGQLQQLFVAENSQARLRMITAGRRRNDQVEILSGLTTGERVIVPVPAELVDSTRVEVRP